jgi:hypothetical protein
MSSRPLLILCLALGAGCASPRERKPNLRHLVVSAPELPSEALDALRVTPRDSVIRVERRGATVSLDLSTTKSFELQAPGSCPLSLDANNLPTHVRLEPRIEITGPSEDVGYDAPFELALRTLCGEAGGPRGTVLWETHGAPLRAVSTLDQGYRVSARTESAPRRIAEARLGDIVPISPNERGLTTLTARWTGADGSVSQRTVTVSAAPRSRGLPNVALGDRTLFGGKGFRIVARPPASQAEPSSFGSLTSIVPDARGLWELASGETRVRLLVGSYDSVPLDCGRAECHAAATHAAENSPMTAAFKHLLDGPGATNALACAVGCHTTGEPGRADGGFSHALHELSQDAGDLPSWDQLPRALRRTGGVGCLACHGPGQLPEASARRAIVRTAVCAYCHDAPPRYGHVKAWQTSAMAESDRDPLTRASSQCARCHTTWGFLDALEGRIIGTRMPPAEERPQGIACAACHAVHDDSAVAGGLLRRVPIASTFADLPDSALERSSACIYCHAPSEGSSPSSSIIWAGRGALDPISQLPLIGPAPHASVPGGCVGCHRAPADDNAHGRGHDFRARRDGCRNCHAERKTSERLLDRARELLTRAGFGPHSELPAHSRARPATSPRERAIELVRLVLEDRGASVHNPRYAEFLLDRAASVLNSTSR